MDYRSQSDSDGRGGRHSWSPSSTGLPDTPRDVRRTQTHDAPLDPVLTNGQLPHAPAVLPLYEIRIMGSTNVYTEGPTVAQMVQASERRQDQSDLVTGTSEEQESQEGNTNSVLRSSSAEDPQSSIRTSMGSASSGQRLLDSPAGGSQIIRTQPKRAEVSMEELKPLNDESRRVVAVPDSRRSNNKGVHSKCEDCHRCCCPECSRPRSLPSCWMCGHRCMCSAQNAVEYGTCVCCIKGLFYHCSSDDEDTSADKPFSCTQPHCCRRWTAISLLALLFPCVLCYVPAKGCLAVCQSCFDRATRPGCQC